MLEMLDSAITIINENKMIFLKIVYFKQKKRNILLTDYLLSK